MILANTHKAITKHLLCARLCSGIDIYMSMCVYAILLTATPEFNNIITPNL